ncbi:unnamed protein product [Notodromas monacha]|uniref:Methyltransferase FkbM domain-containing protein n=1 Tax=Notodromas monacha TaxID=399045 RepID=A0A7R9BMV9_9CRUS|nr:unnamed protein product [Notodromas monacha]CAG0918108.1 unnamed protein product [Notodromas monacha]
MRRAIDRRLSMMSNQEATLKGWMKDNSSFGGTGTNAANVVSAMSWFKQRPVTHLFGNQLPSTISALPAMICKRCGSMDMCRDNICHCQDVSSPTVNPTPESIRPALLMNACDFNDSVFKNWDLGNQSDPHLLQLIKSTVLLKYEDPEQSKNSDVVGMFDLLDNYFDPSDGSFMKRYIIPRFFAQYTKPGVFVEAGSSNGKHLSTSFYLEKRLGWTGVLVEPSPEWDPLSSARRLKRGNSLNAGICLAPQPTPCRATLSVDTDSLGGGRGTILPYHIDEEALGRYQTQVDCFPLFAVLAAAGMTQVDFLSLDLEGVEAWVHKIFKCITSINTKQQLFFQHLLSMLMTEKKKSAEDIFRQMAWRKKIRPKVDQCGHWKG